ncbi:MAG: hypothetical protein NTU89_02515 [Candidatus Dependentiae bacterium]|nr:hypothetical protein [Candidatus Dependentiae bacterium]
MVNKFFLSIVLCLTSMVTFCSMTTVVDLDVKTSEGGPVLYSIRVDFDYSHSTDINLDPHSKVQLMARVASAQLLRKYWPATLSSVTLIDFRLKNDEYANTDNPRYFVGCEGRYIKLSLGLSQNVEPCLESICHPISGWYSKQELNTFGIRLPSN